MNRQLANLLGATGLAIADRLTETARTVLERGGETPAALVVIGHGSGLSNDELRRILRLSHPGTVRLLDRLVSDGLVERHEGEDRRANALFLTRRGHLVRERLLKDRLDAIAPLMAPLTEREQQRLTKLLQKMLSGLDTTQSDRRTLCRLCDCRVCADCPIPSNEARTDA